MAAFLIFSWELRAFFYNVPAFVLSYSLGEILSIVAYMMAFALVETAAIMAVMLVLAALLPGVLLKNGFSYKAAFLFLALGLSSMGLQFGMTNQPKISYLVYVLVRALVGWLVAVLITQFMPFVRKIVLDILDRLTIFSYIYIPIGLLSLVVVAARLLW